MINPVVSEYMRQIAARGGAARTPAKVAASRRTIRLARAAKRRLAKEREKALDTA